MLRTPIYKRKICQQSFFCIGYLCQIVYDNCTCKKIFAYCSNTSRLQFKVETLIAF